MREDIKIILGIIASLIQNPPVDRPRTRKFTYIFGLSRDLEAQLIRVDQLLADECAIDPSGIDRLRAENLELRRQLASLEATSRENFNLKNTLSALNESARKLKVKNEAINEELKQKNQEITKLREKLARKDEGQSRPQPPQGAVYINKQKLDGLLAQIQSYKNQQETNKRQIGIQAAQIHALEAKNAGLLNGIGKLLDGSRDKDSRIESLQTRIGELEKQIREAEEKYRRLLQDFEEYKRKTSPPPDGPTPEAGIKKEPADKLAPIEGETRIGIGAPVQSDEAVQIESAPPTSGIEVEPTVEPSAPPVVDSEERRKTGLFMLPRRAPIFDGSSSAFQFILEKALDMKEMEAYIDASDYSNAKGVGKLLADHRKRMEKFYKKVQDKSATGDLDPDEMTEKFFKTMETIFLNFMITTIFNGSRVAPEFYLGLLPLANEYLTKCGFYTREVLPGNRIQEDDYNDMTIFDKDAGDASEDDIIYEVSSMPYLLDYRRDDGEVETLCHPGTMIVYKFAE